MRIDPMIDGQQNSVQQVDTYPLDYPTGHPKNLTGNGFTSKYTILKDTKEGQAVANYDTSRFWKIVNQDKIHPYAKTPMGWKISSGHTAPFYAKHDSLVGMSFSSSFYISSNIFVYL